MRSSVAFLVIALLGFAPMAQAADALKTLSESEKAAIESVVRDLLVKKEPELVLQAVQEFQKKTDAEAAVKSQAALTGSSEKIFNDPTSPVGGNPKGDVTLVEFYDYQCGYCKTTLTSVEKLLNEDKKVKFVYKEFPILGPDSVTASKAALASIRQGKFETFHRAMMNTKERLSETVIFKVAKDVKLDVDKLKKDMADPAIEKIINTNQMLGAEVGARGTPTFIIGEKAFPGAIPYEQLKAAVEEARKSAKK